MIISRLFTIVFSIFVTFPTFAAEANYPDLPSHDQVDAALSGNINVMNAETGIKIEQVNQRKWESGNYEFTLRTGSARHQYTIGQNTREWNVALERPLRLINKVMIDSDIGEEAVAHANFALGDARHEAGRTLLHLWFNWQREQTQVTQWQQQVENLTQQALTTERRLKAGDAPQMELSQANAAVAQATVALQQARMRSELAGNELARQFPLLVLPQQLNTMEPQPLTENLDYWKQAILNDSHELEMVRSERHIQQMLAQRSRADRVPDPTLGVHVSNEIGNEKITGVYLSFPISFGLRNANAENAEYQAQIAADRENAVHRRLEGDVYATYTQALNSYQIWLQAHEAAASIRQNADLVARAYSLGESSLSETLIARRLALESSLSESLARLDANEAHYRLLLDAHRLWPSGADSHEAH
jgi:outer membrane protein, heavy metal efflux system